MKSIFIAFAALSTAFSFVACHNTVQPPVSNEVVDTVQSVPAKLNAKPVLFETAFVKGTTEKVKSSSVYFYGVTIGKLKVTSGRVVACDPMLIEEYGKPYTQVFPTGEFPVQLSIAKFDNGETLAFARINFSDAPVEKWEHALLEGQLPIPLEGKEEYGFIVDSGVGSFMDEDASKAFDKKQGSSFEGELYKEMDKHYHHRWRYALYNFGNHNMAAFSTGFGDGRYATYIGFDANGKPCRLLSDFGLFDWRTK
jgi:hypothetical protein